MGLGSRGLGQGLQEVDWPSPPPIGVQQADQGWAGSGEGSGEVGQLAPSSSWAGSLGTVGTTVTGHSGHYGVPVPGFLYIERLS